ncbi:MAG: hypothetical protein AB7V58_09755 [Solirubrobacterales bacterium]
MPEGEGAHPPDETGAAATPSAAAEPAQGGAPPPASVPSPPAPDDANDLRGYHFKLLIGSGKTWALIAIPALVVAAVLAAALAPLIGAIALVALVLAGVLVAWLIADNRAATAFFSLYASQRGLQLGGRAPLPPVTPLLRRGDDRYAERTLTGQLGDGCEGTLALFTYEEEHTDSDGNRQTSYYRYTVGLTSVPDCVTHVPELYCQRKFGFRALEKFEDVFRRSKERVKLESEALDERYEIFAGKEQDANWLRQLFSPTFIVWLTDAAPEKFAFELVDGNLCCYVNGHREDAADLDAVSAATTAVSRRLREEAGE